MTEENKPKDSCLKEKKPLLFIYPEFNKPLSIFDYDDLSEENLCILCKEFNDIIKIYIWKGYDFNEPDEVEKGFLDGLI